MLIKVDWMASNGEGHKMYNMFQATEYFVEVLSSATTDINGMLPKQIRLMLDAGKSDVILSNGDVAYVMNDNGKTVDTIRTY